MSQNIFEQDRCREENHGSRLTKFCINENCKNRKLCFTCVEQGIHKDHENYNPNQILNISDIKNDLDKYISSEKNYLNELQVIDKEAKYMIQNISIMFENFTNKINSDKEEQIYRVLFYENYYGQLEKNTISQDDILEILKVFGEDNNKKDISNLRKNIIQIQKYVHKQLDLEQNFEEFVSSYKLKQLEESMFNQSSLYVPPPSINEIEEYQYTPSYLAGQFDEIYGLDISDNQKLVAVAVKIQNQFYFNIYDSEQFRQTHSQRHDCKISSIKASLESKLVFFGDDQGYLGVYAMYNRKIFKLIQIKQDVIDSIFEVSNNFVITISSKDKSIILTDISAEENCSHRIGDYIHQQYCKLAYCVQRQQIIYPSGKLICLQNILIREPFIRQNLEFQSKLPLQIEISSYGNQVLTNQGSQIKHWMINQEQKNLQLLNLINNSNSIINMSFILDDKYIVYDKIDSIQIYCIKKFEQIKTINIGENALGKPYDTKQIFHINNICLIRNNKVIILSKKRNH